MVRKFYFESGRGHEDIEEKAGVHLRILSSG